MHKKINSKISFIFFMLFIFMFSTCFPNTFKAKYDTKELRLVIDSKNTENLPKHFRKTNDKINTENTKLPNLDGLANLKASGSSEFSENGLMLVKQAIGNNIPITVVDLREESHGFVNGMAVNWTNSNNKANKGLTREQVLADEADKLKKLAANKTVTFDNDKNLTVDIKSVQSEEELVKSKGMSYVRIPVTDKEAPSEEAVDYFINFVNSMPQDMWLHFHCRAGIGRTTTFMMMYDMMKNAKKVSLDDIVNRQVLVGGKNLLQDENSQDGHSPSKRSQFIRTFYQYCKENNDNFKTPWSKWLKDKNISNIKEQN